MIVVTNNDVGMSVIMILFYTQYVCTLGWLDKKIIHGLSIRLSVNNKHIFLRVQLHNW